MSTQQIQRLYCCIVLAVVFPTAGTLPAADLVLPADLAPNGGAFNDDTASIAYSAATGELAIDVPVNEEFTSFNINSIAGIFTEQPALNLGGRFDNHSDYNLFKATFGETFGSLSFGNVAQAGLDEQFLLSDFTVLGSLSGGRDMSVVDLIYTSEGPISIPGVNAFNGSFSTESDVDRLALDFGTIPMAESPPELPFQLANLRVMGSNPFDLVSTDLSGDDDRFSTDLALLSNIQAGDARNFSVSLDTHQLGRFRSDWELRLVNSLDSTQTEVLHLELKGRIVEPPRGKLLPEGSGDGTIPMISYDPDSGELFLTSAIGLTAINVSSASGIFTGPTPTDVLGGTFDNYDSQNLFKATFGDSFSNLAFGPVAKTGLTTEFLVSDLTITGSRAVGGGLNNFVFSGFIAIPEPTAIGLLLTSSISVLFGCTGRRGRRMITAKDRRAYLTRRLKARKEYRPRNFADLANLREVPIKSDRASAVVL